MATYFKNVLQSNIGTTAENVLTVANNARITVIGMSLANLTDGIVLVDVKLEQYDDIALPSPTLLGTAYYIKGITIPPNQSLRLVNGGERLVLASSMKVYVQTNVPDSLDLVLSYVEII